MGPDGMHRRGGGRPPGPWAQTAGIDVGCEPVVPGGLIVDFRMHVTIGDPGPWVGPAGLSNRSSQAREPALGPPRSVLSPLRSREN